MCELSTELGTGLAIKRSVTNRLLKKDTSTASIHKSELFAAGTCHFDFSILGLALVIWGTGAIKGFGFVGFAL